ncbi:MAG: winged helix-turn-helix transcriptional regulator [Deltaproteobacteria bacterium]|nr:winged helix-turn-helix transcriptional regulator [Deltaproteobacteria bacterium]
MTEAAQERYDASIFSDEERVSRVVDVLKAVAHPVRLRVVAVLRDGECNVNGLATALDLNPAIVSQQLRILRMSGLVDVTREGGFANYRLSEPHLIDLLQCMEGCVPR